MISINICDLIEEKTTKINENTIYDVRDALHIVRLVAAQVRLKRTMSDTDRQAVRSDIMVFTTNKYTQ